MKIIYQRAKISANNAEVCENPEASKSWRRQMACYNRFRDIETTIFDPVSVFISTHTYMKSETQPSSFFQKRPRVFPKEACIRTPSQRVSKPHMKRLAQIQAEFLSASFYVPE